MKPLDRLLQAWRIRMALPHIRSGDRLLDIGCLDRRLIDRALARVEHAVGIDPAIEPLQSDRFELQSGRFPGELNAEPERFDCITALAVLEHVDDPEGFARACFALLSPGGRVVLTIPHPAVDLLLDILIRLRLADGMATEQHHGFEPAEARRHFERVGFTTTVERRFQLGLNRLFVFEKAIAPCPTRAE